MVQVPTETTVTVVPDTVQTSDVAAVKATVKPEVEIAPNPAGLVPNETSAGKKVKVIDWVALLANVFVTSGAAS
jgi:hypothetical protein